MKNKVWDVHHTCGWSSGEGFGSGCGTGDSNGYGYSLIENNGARTDNWRANTTWVGECDSRGAGEG